MTFYYVMAQWSSEHNTSFFQYLGLDLSRAWNKHVQAGAGRYQKANSKLKMKTRGRRNKFEERCPSTCLKQRWCKGRRHEVARTLSWMSRYFTCHPDTPLDHKMQGNLHFFHVKFMFFKTVVFWDVTPCSLVDKKCFTGMCYLNLVT
jgi:hypothetical protein